MFDEHVAPRERAFHLGAIEIWRHRRAELIVSECDERLPQTTFHANDAIVEKLYTECNTIRFPTARQLESRGPAT